MNHIQLPYGNNQEIYIDPERFYIKPEWIDNQKQSIIMPNIPLSRSNPVYEAYKSMFNYFYNMGYKIITDSTIVDNNAFFFTPCLDKHINSTKEDYVSNKNSKIYSHLTNEGIKEPLTIHFPISSFPDLLPSLPIVLKNLESQGGIEKFLIKTKEQLNILKKFYDEIDVYSRQKIIENVKRQWSYYEDLEFDENGHSNKGICVNFTDYKKEFHKNMVLQKYVNTPTKYNTSLRILTSSSGDILCSSLKYSDNTTPKEEHHYGLFDKYLSEPLSPYFLGNESIISNTAAGGNSIILDKGNFSKLEQEILIAHHIDPNNASLPKNLMTACINIATNCNREIGAICGIDFIFDKEEEAWKYLEEHEYPMLYSYAEKHNLPYSCSNDDFYTTHQLLDMNVRLHALTLTMQKKYPLQKRHI